MMHLHHFQHSKYFCMHRRAHAVVEIVAKGKMMTYSHGAIGLLWFLLYVCKCNGTTPSHEASSDDIQMLTSTNLTSTNQIDGTPGEEVYANSYMYGTEPSLLLSPGKCAMLWSCCRHKACQCPDILPHKILVCGKHKSLSVLNGYCVTIDEKTDTLEAGHCLYNYNTNDFRYEDLPKNKSKLNDFMCGIDSELHRTGTLCGKWQDGYYPLAYSFDMQCVQCPNGRSNWWKFVLAAFLPLTIFYIIILFFKINVVSSRFQGFLFYSQMISMPAMVRAFMFLGKYKNNLRETKAAGAAVRCLATFYGIWNLDFFRSMNFGICLGTDTLQTLALDLIVGVYPLLLMVTSYILIELYDKNFKPLVIIWKPFRRLFGLFRENWDLRTSAIDAFATTFLLTNVKFQSVSFDLLTPVKVYHLNDTGEWTYSNRLFYDATIPYFGSRHLPYGIVALIVITLFAILPALLLVLYPFRCFQKLLNLFPVRWYILHTFVDSFYGSFKDGTQPGTCDCRWFASLFFLSRFCLMFIGAYAENAIFFSVAATILTVAALLFITVQPFKENVSYFTAFFMLLLALWYTCVIGAMQSTAKGHLLTPLFFALGMITAILPLLYISAIVLHWVYSQRKFGMDVLAKLRAWRNGYGEIL